LAPGPAGGAFSAPQTSQLDSRGGDETGGKERQEKKGELRKWDRKGRRGEGVEETARRNGRIGDRSFSTTGPPTTAL